MAAVFCILFSACGKKCYRCKVWHMQGNGTRLYSGEGELCSTETWVINEKLDITKNDSTDGRECEKFYK